MEQNTEVLVQSGVRAQPNYREMLRSDLDVRREKNCRFSLRAYARKLKLSPAYLSQVLNGHRGLSDEKAVAICFELDWPEARKQEFLELVRQERRYGLRAAGRGLWATQKSAKSYRLSVRPEKFDEAARELEAFWTGFCARFESAEAATPGSEIGVAVAVTAL